MRSNERLHRILALRELNGGSAAAARSAPEQNLAFVSDLRLFALTFAGGFLFVSVLIA